MVYTTKTQQMTTQSSTPGHRRRTGSAGDGCDRGFIVHGQQLPIIVFNLAEEGNILRVVSGDSVGTLIQTASSQ